MPKKSYDALLESCERMLKAVRRHGADLAGVAPFRDALERAYTQSLFNRQRQEVARAAAREATRQLRASLSGASDARAALRHFLRSVLGFRSEQLRLFDIQPVKKRSRRLREPASNGQPPGSGPLSE